MQGRMDAGKDGCRKGQMQERTNAGKNECRKRRMHERRDAERKDSRLEGYKKGGFRQERFWTGGIKDSLEVGQVGCRTRGIQDWMDAGKGDS